MSARRRVHSRVRVSSAGPISLEPLNVPVSIDREFPRKHRYPGVRVQKVYGKGDNRLESRDDDLSGDV